MAAQVAVRSNFIGQNVVALPPIRVSGIGSPRYLPIDNARRWCAGVFFPAIKPIPVACLRAEKWEDLVLLAGKINRERMKRLKAVSHRDCLQTLFSKVHIPFDCVSFSQMDRYGDMDGQKTYWYCHSEFFDLQVKRSDNIHR